MNIPNFITVDLETLFIRPPWADAAASDCDSAQDQFGDASAEWRATPHDGENAGASFSVAVSRTDFYFAGEGFSSSPTAISIATASQAYSPVQVDGLTAATARGLAAALLAAADDLDAIESSLQIIEEQ